MNIIHIVEYKKRGPLWKLVSGLTVFDNHFVLETKERYIDLCNYDSDAFYVIHTSGKNFPMISSLKQLLSQGIKCAVFIHTLPDYIIDKGFSTFLTYIYEVQKASNCKILVPSTKASEMFGFYRIHTDVVNLGIPPVTCRSDKPELKQYCNKIVTVSTKDTDKYKYAKGIDRFSHLINDRGLEKKALILGNNSGTVDNVLNLRLSHEDFLYVLAHSKAYVQLSRSESYNISVIEAKQLKLPVLVSDVAGHRDSVPNSYCRVDSIEDAKRKLEEILKQETKVKHSIIENYKQSIEHESIQAFRNRLENVILR